MFADIALPNIFPVVPQRPEGISMAKTLDLDPLINSIASLYGDSMSLFNPIPKIASTTQSLLRLIFGDHFSINPPAFLKASLAFFASPFSIPSDSMVITFVISPDSIAIFANKYPSPALFPGPQNTVSEDGLLLIKASNENLAALSIRINP